MRSAQRSRDLIAHHAEATTLFSLATIAFHVFFVLWVGKLLLPAPQLWIAIPIAAVCALLGARRAILWVAALALLVSLAMLVSGFAKSEIPYVATDGRMSAVDLVALLLVCCFGFGLSPYLDLTFHRAYQHTRSPRFSFTVGFGVFFLSMIAFTLFYSGWMDQIVANRARPEMVLAILGWHILIQSAFTVGIHAREVAPRMNWWLAAIFVCFIIAPFVPRWLFVRSWGYNLDEAVYRVFMGFYGLIFPAYVWICITPGRGRMAPGRRQRLAFTISVLAALPMFWMGFIEQQLIWLLPGVAVVLLAGLVVRRTDVSATQH
jgi:hypothetical protein